MNIVLFGLPEQSLLETRKTVDEVLSFLCGTSVPIRDLIRLGKYSEDRSRPVLVKLLNFWDKRILLASRAKLKSFRINRIFVRPDLSPEERALRRAKFSSNRRQESSASAPAPNSLESSDEHPVGPSSRKSVSADVHLPA